MSWLGIDVGGANLKAADGESFALTQAFELWRSPMQLTQRLRQLIAGAPPSDHLVATMTGELADCFPNKAEGVRHIVNCLMNAAAGRHVRIYALTGRFVTPQFAMDNPGLVAAANWHALGRFAQRFATAGAPGILVDIGSTTTDLVPLMDDPCAVCGQTDTDRLTSGSLIYTGITRSPVCAVAQRVCYRGKRIRVAQEMFATMRDVYLVLGALTPDPTDRMTADNRPATKADARVRLGRMICADENEFHHKDAAQMATLIAKFHTALIAKGIAAMWERLGTPRAITLVLSGRGEFLARRAIEVLPSIMLKARAAKVQTPLLEFETDRNFELHVSSLLHELGSAISSAAAAHAVAVLAKEKREIRPGKTTN